MPHIKIDDMDVSAFPTNVRERYLSDLRQGQQMYYLLIMIMGCLFFFVGWLI